MSNQINEFTKALRQFNEQMARFDFLISPEKEEGVVETLKSLLHSRKFLLTAFGVVQTVVSHYFQVPPEVWASVNGLVVILIGAIAYEDGSEKKGGTS